MIPVHVIGMGLSFEDLTARHLSVIEKAEILVGGRRHLDCFPDHPAEKHVIRSKIRELAEQIKEWAVSHQVVALASGDPLFYGIGQAIIDVLGKENVVVHPNVTSVAGAFARIGETWQHAGVISLHGRDLSDDLAEHIKGCETVAVFTDKKNSPSTLASLIGSLEQNGYRMCVLECMGTDTERVGWYDLSEAAVMTFQDPNMVVLKKMSSDFELESAEKSRKQKKMICRAGFRPPMTAGESPPYGSVTAVHPELGFIGLGMPDDVFAHQRGLITKPEVRAVSLSKLDLKPDHVMWDLGAGSGSVSIEAAGFITEGRIFAVEQYEDRVLDIIENMNRFGVDHMSVIQAALPEGIGEIPDPDRIFVGGGGKNLEVILKAACERLKSGGVIVVNTVLLANVQIAMKTLADHGFETDIVQIQVNTGHAMPWDLMLKAQNPVFIIRGRLK